MQGLLDKEGSAFDRNIYNANIIVINTYSFIETARKE